MMLSDKYFRPYVTVPNDPAYIDAENKRLEKQAHCSHNKWATRCAHCGAVLDSDALHESEAKSHEQIL